MASSPTGCLVAGLAQFAQAIEISVDKSLLFRARPTLELRLALAGFGKGRINFDPQKCERNVERGRLAGLTRDMITKALLQIDRCSDVEYAGAQTQEIDDARAPRQARAIRRASAINLFILFAYAGRRP